MMRILALSVGSLSLASGVSAQSAPSQPPPSQVMESPPPRLAPPLRVPPAPQAETEKPAQIVPQQCICTMEYAPVCARTRDGTEATYSNACRARCVGATVIRQGAC